MKNFFGIASQLTHERESFVVVTLLSVRGGAPADVGAKAIIAPKGLHWGSVGGGKVEARAIEHSLALMGRKILAPEVVTWNLQRDIGMTCGGEVTLLFELHRSDSWQIVVYGAGHVGQALVRALEPLNCRLTCIDHRVEWHDRLPVNGGLQRRFMAEPASSVAEFDDRTFFVVMTQGHATDVPILEAIFRYHPNAPYIGVIGSDVKGLKIRSELRTRGVSDELLSRLRCPIGLPIGGNDPTEIAISVAAELLQIRDRWLKD